MNVKKMAILTVSPELLRSALCLPDGCEVVRVQMAQGYRGVIELVIDGAGWDTREGSAIMPARIGIGCTAYADNGKILSHSIDWGLENK